MRENGFTLVEVIMALFLIGIGVLAAAPMFMYAMQSNATGADLGSVGAIAVERMELLRAAPYVGLTAGGDLSANVNGYFDTANPDYTVRWTVTNNVNPPKSKTITVRAVAVRQVVGLRKDVVLTTMRAL